MPDPIYAYVARKKARRFHSQLTHTLVQCVRTADGSLVFLQERPQEWKFLTQWWLARAILLANWADAEVQELDTELRQDGSADILGTKQRWEVWPTPFKQEKKGKMQGPHFGDEEKKRQANETAGAIERRVQRSVSQRRERMNSTRDE